MGAMKFAIIFLCQRKMIETGRVCHAATLEVAASPKIFRPTSIEGVACKKFLAVNAFRMLNFAYFCWCLLVICQVLG